MRAAIILAAAAIAAAFVPIPAELVERWYSQGVYPPLQRVLTPASSVIPVALLDVSVPIVLASWLVFVVRRWRRAGAAAGLKASALSFVAGASVLYLAFFLLWGLNYQRQTLESKLAYEPSRVTREAIHQFAEGAVERLNALRTADTFVPVSDRVTLEAAFARAQQRIGATRTAIPAPPKRSMFSWYLRTAGIDGMMNPFFLEIILNPDILPVERPFSLAHEWGHLAGYANESEANFVAWLTCVEGDAAAQYSGWLEAFRYAAGALASMRPEDRRRLSQRLAPAVVADLTAINERLGRADPAVSGFARNVYDSYLRAQGVDEGIASYGAMLRLMVGTTFDNGWAPRLRGKEEGRRKKDEGFSLAKRFDVATTNDGLSRGDRDPGPTLAFRYGQFADRRDGRVRFPREGRRRASAAIRTDGIGRAACQSGSAAGVLRRFAAATDTPVPNRTPGIASLVSPGEARKLYHS